MRHRIAMVLVMAAGVSACTAPIRTPPEDPRSGQVGFSEVDSAVVPSSRLSLAQNESFQPPLPDAGNAPPDYPEALLAQRLPPQTVCVRLSIDESGTVFDAAPVDQGPDCTMGMTVESAFFEAAAHATRQWRFEPAFRCVFPEGSPPDSACGFEGTQEIPQPVSLTFRFVFEQIDGEGQVKVD